MPTARTDNTKDVVLIKDQDSKDVDERVDNNDAAKIVVEWVNKTR